MEKFMFLNWFDNMGVCVSLPVVGELIDYSRDLLLWYNGGRPQSGAVFISKLMEVSNSCMSYPNNFEPNCCGSRVDYVKL